MIPSLASLIQKPLEVESETEVMSGSGTDKTKSGRDLAGPVVILVEPQLGENIGMAARAMHGRAARPPMPIISWMLLPTNVTDRFYL